MLGPFATASRRTPINQVSLVTPPAHRCPRQQRRQRVTEGTAMAPWNGPNDVEKLLAKLIHKGFTVS